jgi:hypothetical protein
LRSRPGARFAYGSRVDFDLLMNPENDIRQRHVESNEGILSALTARSRTATTTTRCATKERRKNVVEISETTRESLLGPAVVLLALHWVGQNLVGVRHKLELFFSFRGRVHIGVKLAREFSIRLLDGFGVRVTSDAENLIVVSHE